LYARLQRRFANLPLDAGKLRPAPEITRKPANRSKKKRVNLEQTAPPRNSAARRRGQTRYDRPQTRPLQIMSENKFCNLSAEIFPRRLQQVAPNVIKIIRAVSSSA
jgi:hypothetical protein